MAEEGAKRPKWTARMEEAYEAALAQLGGLMEAKPKGILELMEPEFPQLTLHHVKWHLVAHRRRHERHREMEQAGAVLPTRWVGRLEEAYEAAVAQLGGLWQARPKAIMQALQAEFPDLNVQVVKWHLQEQRRKEQRRMEQAGEQPPVPLRQPEVQQAPAQQEQRARCVEQQSQAQQQEMLQGQQLQELQPGGLVLPQQQQQQQQLQQLQELEQQQRQLQQLLQLQHQAFYQQELELGQPEAQQQQLGALQQEGQWLEQLQQLQEAQRQVLLQLQQCRQQQQQQQQQQLLLEQPIVHASLGLETAFASSEMSSQGQKKFFVSEAPWQQYIVPLAVRASAFSCHVRQLCLQMVKQLERRAARLKYVLQASEGEGGDGSTPGPGPGSGSICNSLGLPSSLQHLLPLDALMASNSGSQRGLRSTAGAALGTSAAAREQLAALAAPRGSAAPLMSARQQRTVAAVVASFPVQRDAAAAAASAAMLDQGDALPPGMRRPRDDGVAHLTKCMVPNCRRCAYELRLVERRQGAEAAAAFQADKKQRVQQQQDAAAAAAAEQQQADQQMSESSGSQGWEPLSTSAPAPAAAAAPAAAPGAESGTASLNTAGTGSTPSPSPSPSPHLLPISQPLQKFMAESVPPAGLQSATPLLQAPQQHSALGQPQQQQQLRSNAPLLPHAAQAAAAGVLHMSQAEALEALLRNLPWPLPPPATPGPPE